MFGPLAHEGSPLNAGPCGPSSKGRAEHLKKEGQFTNMLKITIELHPHGRIVENPKVWNATIHNTGTGTETRGNYKAIFSNVRSVWGRAHFNGFARKSNSVWALLKGLLNNIDGQ